MADLGAPLPRDQCFLYFMQFFGKINKIVYLVPPEGWRPPPCEIPESATRILALFIDIITFSIFQGSYGLEQYSEVKTVSPIY